MSRTIYKIVIFFLVFVLTLPAQGFSQVLPYMPPVGQMITQSAKPYDLPYIVGMRFSSDNIFEFTFFLNRGNVPAKEDILRNEVDKVGKYFLAALTIPEKDLWVNLSPYEQERIITPELGRTDLGKDLLGEDYVLKQLASSLTFPDSESGKQYWQLINGVGANNHSPVNNFSKVWIVPGTIKMKEASDRVVITEATLKVLTEEDYLAMNKRNGDGSHFSGARNGAEKRTVPVCVPPKAGSIEANGTLGNRSSQAMRNIIVPLIEKEVNTGKHFAHLRQVYRAIILAGWFKKKLKDTILTQVYFDQKKIKGAENNDPALKEKIYNEYVKAFNQGVYNVIKKESVGANNHSPVRKITKRQYFSGGAAFDEGVISAADHAEPAASNNTDAKRAVDGVARQKGGTEARLRMEEARENGDHEDAAGVIERIQRAALREKPTDALDRAIERYGAFVLGENLLGQRSTIFNEVRTVLARLPQKEVDREREFGYLLEHYKNEVERQKKYIDRLDRRSESTAIREGWLELEALEYVVAILPGLEVELRVPPGAQASFPFDRFAHAIEKQPTPVPQPTAAKAGEQQLSLPFAGEPSSEENGGFDFAKTNANAQVETTGGGLKLSAPKAAAYLANGKVSGFKLAILALRY